MVRVQGRLARTPATELERICRESPGILSLDLTRLMSADDGGILTLRRLMSDGAQCTGISPYLALLLRRE